jgi:hypothetical protein
VREDSQRDISVAKYLFYPYLWLDLFGISWANEMPWTLLLAARTGKRATFLWQRRTIRCCYYCLLVAVAAQSNSSSCSSFSTTAVVVQAYSIFGSNNNYALFRRYPHTLLGAFCNQRRLVVERKTRQRRRPLYTLEPSYSESEANSDNNDDDDLERWEALYQQGQMFR